MARAFFPVDRDQLFLLPQDLREWVPADHVVHFLIDVVERLDLSVVVDAYCLGYQGRAAYDPAMLLTLLLYSSVCGVRSSRRIERACRTDAAYRLICGSYGATPDHVTICRFRQRHQDAIADVFVQVLLACHRAGLVPLTVIVVDGTKFEADASLDANRKVETLRAEAVRILTEMDAVDGEESARFGDRRGDEMPSELVDAARRLECIEEALAYAEAELAGGDEARVNLTDPESRVMRNSRGGYLQGYNAQVVAAEGDVIVAARMTNHENDLGLLGPMVREATENLDAAGIEERPGTVVADAGYFDTKDVSEVVSDPDAPEPLVATRKRKDQPTDIPEGDPEADHVAENEAIAVDEAVEVARRVAVFERVQAGEINQTEAAAELGLDRGWVSVVYRAWLDEGEEAIRLKNPPRTHPRPSQSQLARRAMETKLADPANRALYKKRSHLAETPFAAIKYLRNGGRLSRRGLRAANAEFVFEATAHNITRLHAGLGVLALLLTTGRFAARTST